MATKEGYSTFGPRERVEMRFGRLVNAPGLTPDCLTDFGDLMCLATDLHVLDTVSTYRLCWSIECTFSSMKSRGFDLERIGMTRKKRLERLLGLVTLVWMWSLRVGVDGARQRPIRVKSHGRKELSGMTAGWERLAHALRSGTSQRSRFTELRKSLFPAPDAV